TRMNRWSKSGVLDRVFERLQLAALADRAHQDRGGLARQHHRQGSSRWLRGAKKTAPKPSANPEAAGPPRFIWLLRMLERSNGHNVRAVAGPCRRRSRRPRTAQPPGRAQSTAAPAHGSRLRGQRDNETRGLELDL